MSKKDLPRLSRLASIQNILQSKPLVTSTELSKKFGISVRTVYRDIRALEKAGLPIVTEEGKGYSLVQGFRLPPVSFTTEEANAVITAQKLVEKNSDKSWVDNFADAVTKIKATFNATAKENAELLANRVSVKQGAKHSTTTDYLAAIQLAIVGNRLLHLDYKTEDIETKRDVEPLAIYLSNENWILIGWCRLRKDLRSFRLDRMKLLQVTQNTFSPRAFDLDQYFSTCLRSLIYSPDTLLSSSAVKLAGNSKNMNTVTQESKEIVGIAVRTTNQNNWAMKDIPALWERWFTESISAKIHNKVSEEVYAIYTDYESDHNGPYTTILGCAVAAGTELPEGMVKHFIPTGKYAISEAKGNISEGAVAQAWQAIWSSNLPRNYQSDFEVYGAKAANPKDAVVDIYVGVE